MSFQIISFWILISLTISGFGLIYIITPKLPQFIQDILLYGKARGKRKEKTIVQWLEIPKRSFLHFYLFGSIVNGYMTYTVASCYLLGQPPPQMITDILHYLAPEPTTSINGMNTILLLVLMFVQNIRRLYECLFVSVYSNGTINVLHYISGMALYGTFWMAVLAEAPDLHTYRVNNIDEEFVRWQNHVAIALFTWASYHHHHTHKTLAALRKNSQGEVTSYQHAIPSEGWFDYISCPHYFFEMIIYGVFQLVAGVHITVLSITFFVFTNQLLAGHLTHSWYKNNFKQYPAERKAIIPWIF